MLTELRPLTGAERDAVKPTRFRRVLLAFAQHHPYISLCIIIFASNGFGSAFNIVYNQNLIVERLMSPKQKALFYNVALPIYNLLAYPAGIAITVRVLMPMVRCRRKLLANEVVPAALMLSARRRVVNLPRYLIFFNMLLWAPGGVFFPLVICGFGGQEKWILISVQFLTSFTVSALITAANTFFWVEQYLIIVMYPMFFQDARPADVDGVVKIPFWFRLVLLWFAVACMPIVALLVVALNPIQDTAGDAELLRGIAITVALLGILASGAISWIVGGDLLVWLRRYGKATEQIRNENFAERIPQKRPDEWGQLNDRFNDMATGLEAGRRVHETFGQFVGLEARGEILDMLSRLGGEVRDITVCFLDIRGFTRRSAGERPERIVELLNEFFTLAVAAIERNEGMVNKFLGDGFMAIFGGPPDWHDNHADLAVRAAVELIQNLENLNWRLLSRGEAPLKVGIGIHSGPALVGCIGTLADGRKRPRKELTAIGETVNLCQRVEQLTKTCDGPILISGNTQQRLKAAYKLVDCGVQELERSNEKLQIYCVQAW